MGKRFLKGKGLAFMRSLGWGSSLHGCGVLRPREGRRLSEKEKERGIGDCEINKTDYERGINKEKEEGGGALVSDFFQIRKEGEENKSVR